MENNIKKEPTIEELNKIINFYKMEIYKKNITIKQLRYRIYIEENIKKNLSKL
jgi:hypothetical protein